MAKPMGLEPYSLADFDGPPEGIVGYNGNLIFNIARLTWSEPFEWKRKAPQPEWPQDAPSHRPGVYAVLRDHHHQKDDAGRRQHDRLVYIGFAQSLKGRLTKAHKTAQKWADKKDPTRISYGVFEQGHRNQSAHLLELEDILIWACWKHLHNIQNLSAMPSMRVSSGRGVKRSRPWIIHNRGYDFGGQMPREIVYPWMLVR